MWEALRQVPDLDSQPPERESSQMKIVQAVAGFVVGALVVTGTAIAQNEGQGQGQAILTVLPAHGNEGPSSLNRQDLSIKVDGKDSAITSFTPLQGNTDRLEVVVMIDAGARTSMSNQLGDIASFIKELPSNSKAAVAYMENGVARLTGPLSTNHNQVAGTLHIPVGLPGQDASPYFCLSDLAKHWPSQDRGARREVVMITDGVDYYDPHFDMEDPYVQAAIHDSVQSGLVVYSIYYQNKGRFDRTLYANNAGQNLILQVTQATGGNSYWQGFGDPVSFQPYLKDIARRLQNQYELSFSAPLKDKPDVANFKLKVSGVSGKVEAPQQVYVSRSM